MPQPKDGPQVKVVCFLEHEPAAKGSEPAFDVVYEAGDKYYYGASGGKLLGPYLSWLAAALDNDMLTLTPEIREVMFLYLTSGGIVNALDLSPLGKPYGQVFGINGEQWKYSRPGVLKRCPSV